MIMEKPSIFTIVRIAFKIGELTANGEIEEFEDNEAVERIAVKLANDFENEIDVLDEEEGNPMLYAERNLLYQYKAN